MAAHPRLALYLRVAATTGVPFGVLAAAWLVVRGATEPGPVALGAVLAGLLFGAGMSAVLGTLQWRTAVADRERRRRRDPDAPIEIGPAVSRTVAVDAPPADVLRRAAEAGGVIGARVVTTGEDTVTLAVPTSWRSWGERVTVAAGPGDGVTISSRPALRSTVVDFGRNARNVERVEAWLGARR